jgi:hypothetical protein
MSPLASELQSYGDYFIGMGEVGYRIAHLYLGTEIKRIKKALKEWVKFSFVSPKKEKLLLLSQLEDLQSRMEKEDITKQHHVEERALCSKLHKVTRLKEEMWHLKSRSLWL